jgi:hypothetical protein
MLESTSKYEVVDIIYDNDGFAIAKGYWDGDKSTLRLACRWHEKDGIGYPQTFGKPQWMMFPYDLSVDIFNSLNPPEAEVKITFN